MRKLLSSLSSLALVLSLPPPTARCHRLWLARGGKLRKKRPPRNTHAQPLPVSRFWQGNEVIDFFLFSLSLPLSKAPLLRVLQSSRRWFRFGHGA